MIIIKWNVSVIDGAGGIAFTAIVDTFAEAMTALKLHHEEQRAEQGDEVPNALYSIVPVRTTTDEGVGERCKKCGTLLVFSARQRGDGLCGPCSRARCSRCKGTGRIITDCNGDPDDCPDCVGRTKYFPGSRHYD